MRWQWVTISNNEWQWVTMSDNDNEWQWQWVAMTMSDNEWQWVTMSDNELLWHWLLTVGCNGMTRFWVTTYIIWVIGLLIISSVRTGVARHTPWLNARVCCSNWERWTSVLQGRCNSSQTSNMEDWHCGSWERAGQSIWYNRMQCSMMPLPNWPLFKYQQVQLESSVGACTLWASDGLQISRVGTGVARLTPWLNADVCC